ncbi:hypothetical protein QR98_0018000 [Sarcoptes scabiei]|uniref:PAS domain-containing protein n=1 Tax=Sarcoptes scabiei TaxID=52283 RepID=A0A131ZXZ3_SARSC|nr:hypothetical protein QR98_0018000 [Sarcoptes scabiei]
MESPSSIHDDDDDFDFDDSLDESLSHHIDDKNFSDSLSFDDNEALASDPSKGESFASTEALKDKQLTLSEEKRKRILMLKRKKQKQQSSKDSLLPCLPRYELMQVNTRFISNSESKQIDTLTTINNLKHHTSSFGLGSLNSSSMHTDCASSIHHHQQMIEESRVLCVARRLPDSEQQPIDNDGQNNVQIEQFTTRLDFHGRVTFLDTSSMSTKFSWNINYLKNNLINNLLHDFVHPDDLKKVQQHLKEAIINGSVQAAISKFYRLKIGPDQYAKVSTKTKLLKNGSLMAKHSIFFEQNSYNQVKKEVDDELVNTIINSSTSTSTTTSSSTSSSNNNRSGDTDRNICDNFGIVCGNSSGQSSTTTTSTSTINSDQIIGRNSPKLSTTLSSISDRDSSSMQQHQQQYLQQTSTSFSTNNTSSISTLSAESSSINSIVDQWNDPLSANNCQSTNSSIVQLPQTSNNSDLFNGL